MVHSEALGVLYSANQFLGLDFFFAISYSKPALIKGEPLKVTRASRPFQRNRQKVSIPVLNEAYNYRQINIKEAAQPIKKSR